jgi:hypothetical protein
MCWSRLSKEFPSLAEEGCVLPVLVSLGRRASSFMRHAWAREGRERGDLAGDFFFVVWQRGMRLAPDQLSPPLRLLNLIFALVCSLVCSC